MDSKITTVGALIVIFSENCTYSEIPISDMPLMATCALIDKSS